MATQEITNVRLLDNYVGGEWTPSTSSEALPVLNPATGDALARVPLSSAEDLDAAVAAARAALPALARRVRDRARPAPVRSASSCSTAAARTWRAR